LNAPASAVIGVPG